MAETVAVLTFSTRIDGGAPAIRYVDVRSGPEQIDVVLVAGWVVRRG